MKKQLLSILLISFAIVSNTASADKYAIKIKSCMFRSAFVKDPSHFGRRSQAKQFSSEQAATDYLEKLSPKLKNMRPRVVPTNK